MQSIEKYSVGVIVGRFQIDDLHEGHYDLIKSVYDVHDKTLIIIGLSPCKCTINNPLDFDTRRRMLMAKFPKAKIGYIEDMYSDDEWSKQLDKTIWHKVRTNSVLLYGSRDSFIKYYSGKYDTFVLEPRVYISASKLREGIIMRSRDTADFRAGAIWAMGNQYANPLPTVDAAIISADRKRILLAKRDLEDKYRLFGGFAESGETYEDTLIREVKEEAGIDVIKYRPVRSFFIDDWRYKSEMKKITTFLYIVDEFSGVPKPDDDVDEVAWFDINVSLIDQVVPNHREMIEYLLDNEFVD
jgi:bifunctional NMN adenylyltransferase/nudix hydrolase